jgi:hypothetical protein
MVPIFVLCTIHFLSIAEMHLVILEYVLFIFQFRVCEKEWWLPFLYSYLDGGLFLHHDQTARPCPPRRHLVPVGEALPSTKSTHSSDRFSGATTGRERRRAEGTPEADALKR